jgi:hypothetical protein
MSAKQFVQTYIGKISYVVADANVRNLKAAFANICDQFTDEEAEFFLHNSDSIALTALRLINGK